MRLEPSLLQLPGDDLDYVVHAVGVRWERLRGQRILLTGGTGFIGKWLLATFLHANQARRLGARISVLSRQPEALSAEFPEIHGAKEIEWLRGDVRELQIDAARDCSFAIHAATDVVASATPAETLSTCIGGTQRVLDALCAGKGARRMLLLSSGAIYGRICDEIARIPEEWSGAPDSLLPTSAYGEGKRVSELLCAMAAATTPQLEVSIARCFAFVGPHLRLDRHFAIGNFIRAAMRNEDIRIKGDGTPIRSYLYAADLAHWLWCMLFDAPSGRAYNVGGAECVSIRELASRVNQILDGQGRIHMTETQSPSGPPQRYVPSIERIALELNLTPATNLDNAVLKTAQWSMKYARE